MHKSTKITPVLRKELFARWKIKGVSQRQLAKEYHVDKRVVGRIIERGKNGDFDVHSSVNKRFLKKTSSAHRKRSKKTVVNTPKKRVERLRRKTKPMTKKVNRKRLKK